MTVTMPNFEPLQPGIDPPAGLPTDPKHQMEVPLDPPVMVDPSAGPIGPTMDARMPVPDGVAPAGRASDRQRPLPQPLPLKGGGAISRPSDKGIENSHGPSPFPYSFPLEGGGAFSLPQPHPLKGGGALQEPQADYRNRPSLPQVARTERGQPGYDSPDEGIYCSPPPDSSIRSYDLANDLPNVYQQMTPGEHKHVRGFSPDLEPMLAWERAPAPNDNRYVPGDFG